MAQIDDDLTALAANVTAEQTAVDGAVTALNGVQKMITDAVAAALAAGATPAQLQAITDGSAALARQTAALATAVATVPSQPAPPPPVVPVAPPAP